MKFTFFLLLLFITSVSNATDYYVSATGSDSNNGTSETTPWKSLSKVESVSNAGTIHAGDRILFKKGDSFTGTMSIGSLWGHSAKSGTATSPITLGSYGTGAKPTMLYPQGGSLASESRMLMFFVGIDYWVIDGLNFTDLNTVNDHVTGANCGVPIYLGSYGDAPCNHWTIKNVDISLCGMGVVIIGDYNTVTGCSMTNFKNLKSTPNTGGSTAWEDYGANPFTIIWANNNVITHNYVSGGWAESMDFGYNGGFAETIGTCSNNQITYNTIVDCNGLSEFGQGGNSTDNLYAYNKLVDCGAMFWVNSDCQVTNAQFYNNTVIETTNSRFAQGSPNAGAGVVSPEAISHLNVDVNMFDYSGSSQTAATVFNLKNNIIQISNPLKITKSGSKLAHDYNVVKLSGGSAFGLSLNTHDKSTSAVIFTNTTSPSASSWDLNPPPASPPIDAGTNVGIATDFIGNPVPAVPNAGILEGSATGPSTLDASSTAGNISCNGGTTTVTVAATGGTAPYTGTGNFTVGAGSYTYTVTDATGTSKTTSITITQPTVLAATLSAGTITLFGGTTTLTASASGGTAGYTYKLNSGSYQSSNAFTSVAAGTYTVTVKDANGCTSVQTITITQPGAPDPLVASSAAGTITCNGATTTVTVSGTGGTTPYTGTGTFTISAGTYNYTVTDAAGQTATTSVTVTQPSAIAVTVSAGTILVNGGTTSVTVNANGGTGAYTYKMDNGSYQASNAFTGVAAGNYSVTVKDKNGCNVVKSFVITEPGSPNPLVASSAATTISCNGATTTVTVSASGGTTPYTGTGTFTISAGTYNYTVTDAAGQTATTAVTITQPTLLILTANAGTITINGGTTTITASAIGGTGAYTYKLNNGSYQSSGSFTNIAAGTYTVTVKDKSGCTSVKTIVITQPGVPGTLTVSATAGTISCNGGTTTVTVSATGGVAPYTGTGTFNVTARTYTYTVTDAAGTVKTATVAVTQPAAIVLSVTAGTIATSGGTTKITATATGGSGSFTYQLNSGTYQSSGIFTNVAAGTYTITVKDKNGCTLSKAVTITQPGTGTFKLNLVSKTNESCKNKKDGKIVVNCAGGTAPYTYRINFGAFSSNNTFTNLRPGFYIVTGKSATGATSTLYIVISASSTTCASGKTGFEVKPADITSESLKINVYPNPTTTEFSLVLEKGNLEEAHIFVTNMNGQPVYEGRAKSFEKINFGRNFLAGIYFVKVVQGKSVQTSKIIKIN